MPRSHAVTEKYERACHGQAADELFSANVRKDITVTMPDHHIHRTVETLYGCIR